jgi:transcriptional regulator with PAS, ATPase and Fis domain
MEGDEFNDIYIWNKQERRVRMSASINSNILLIAPYIDLKEVSENAIKENGYDVEVVLGDLSNGVKMAKEAEKSGVQVIITRGGTFQQIKHSVSIPVVEIQINAFDILRAFKGLINYKEPIGIVGYENVVYGIETLTEVLNLNLYKVIFNSESDAPRQVYEVASKGIKEFVGDSIGIKTVKRMGLNGHLITSGKEAVIAAIEEAYRVVKIRREERARAQRFNIIMDFVHDGIIAIDDKENVTISNKVANHIFGIHGNDSANLVRDVVESIELSEVLKTKEPQYGQIKQIGGVTIATNRVPIIVDNKVQGAVATFQDITQIQNMEQKIRRELNQKGLVAKYNFKDILYKSSVMEEIIDQAKKYAKLDSTTILILGETGTGKELLSQSMHNFSPRLKGPFVAINCAALPENLLESELFGYVEGAFTGAKKGGKMGLFEMAHRGTIFLDEIGDMPLNLQTRFLRVLQEKEVMRIGDDKVIPIDVRVIASTNRDLKVDIEKGSFRRDLFYRLNILTLETPPLRDRKEDIPLLVNLYIEIYSKMLGKKVQGVTEETKKVLMDLEYKGNVRELRGLIERAVAYTDNELISVKDLGILEKVPTFNNKQMLCGLTLKQIEELAIKDALKIADNNISRAAKILGIDRSTLWRKIKELQPALNY